MTADLGPPSERLVKALAEDILEGRLATGDRLPPHRDLADSLDISVGTVTKAYGLLERRGLVRTVKGSGTFVALVQARRGPLTDLARNTAPGVMTERLLSRTLSALAKRVDAGLFNDYPPAGGHDEHRRLMARWFQRVGMEADPRRLLLTSGAQHAISVAMSVACGPRGTVFVEAQTYPGVLTVARHQGARVVGVAMDAEGVVPELLDQAMAEVKNGPAALYLTPTMQNPTTATMSRHRRRQVVAVCRAHGAFIIEDDVYTLAEDVDLPPLAMLAPERTFYASSMSKTLNPSLRVGGLVAPASMYDASLSALQGTAMMVSPLSCAVMEQWSIDGTAQAISDAIRAESRRRMELARDTLGPLMREPQSDGYHVWMPLPLAEAIRLEQAASEIGIAVTPPLSTAADPRDAEGGIRLCLGSAPLSDLDAALRAITRLCAGQRPGDED